MQNYIFAKRIDLLLRSWLQVATKGPTCCNFSVILTVAGRTGTMVGDFVKINIFVKNLMDVARRSNRV